MSSAIAAPTDRSRQALAFEGGHATAPSEGLPEAETIYRQRFSRVIGVPVLMAAVISLIASAEEVWPASVLPDEEIVYAIIGPCLVMASLLWSVLVWYGNHVRVGETVISIQTMGLLLGIRTKTVARGEIRDVALSGRPWFFWKSSVVLTVGEGRRVVIDGILESECLYWQIRAGLSG